MTNDIEDSISILTYCEEDHGAGRGILPSPMKSAAKYTDVQTEILEENFKKVVRQLSKVVDSAPDASGKFYIDKFEFSLNIDASGKFSLIGELSAGVSTGITITLSRRNNDTNV